MEKRFAGKVAFVTGATTGIGQATAVRLAAHGGAICCTSSLSTHVGSPSQVAYCAPRRG